MTINAQVSAVTNLTGPNLNVPSLSSNSANTYFNNFYSTPFNVSAGANDAITAFFQEYCPNLQAAESLASAVLYTALAQNIDPLKLLSDFESLPKGQLTNYLVAFLNVTRVPTSMLGINNGAQVSPFITRTILA
jgi:hypothetical protein